MKQRGRNRPFWDKGVGGGRPGERAARETKPRESPGERAARAFEERDPRRRPPRPPRDAEGREEARPQDASRPRLEERRPRQDERRPPQDERRPRQDSPRADKHQPRFRADEPRRPKEEPRREPAESRRRHDADHDAHREAEGSLLFGVQPVLEALRAGQRPVERVTVVEGAQEGRVYEIMELARAARVPVRRAPRAELQRLAAGANHQGVVASVAAARYLAAEELLEALAARVGTEDPPLALVLDGVADPRNLGAIIRTAECAGAHGLFLPERRAAGLTETAAKAAAGALEYVPVARATNLSRLVDELKGRGVWTIGTAADAPVSYTEWDWTQPCAVVLGGEGEGLRRLVREHCDVLVRIPLRGHISSLNVSVAAGVLLYEALRQRTAAGGRT